MKEKTYTKEEVKTFLAIFWLTLVADGTIKATTKEIDFNKFLNDHL